MRTTYFIIAAATLVTATLAQNTNTTVSVPSTNQTTAAESMDLESRTVTERVDFLFNVAQAYIDEGDYESAVSTYERVLEINPTHQQTRYVLAYICIEAKQYDKAERHFLSLVDAHPDDAMLLNNLAWLYATADDPKMRDGDKAINLAKEAMVLSPFDHHIWSTLSEAYYVCGEYDKALRSIEHMVRVAGRYATQPLTQEQINEYISQIRKCERAVEAQKALDEVSGN